MTSQFRSRVAPKPPIRTSSVSTSNTEDIDDPESLYDDVIHVKKKLPLPVPTKSKQLMSGQRNSPEPIYDDTLSSTTISLQNVKVPPPVATRFKQEQQRNNPQAMYDGNASTKELITRSSSQKVPPPVAPKPMSPVTARRNSPLYNSTKPILTKLSLVATKSAPPSMPIAEQEIYDDTVSIRQITQSPMQRSPVATKLTPSFTEFNDGELSSPKTHRQFKSPPPKVALKPSPQKITSSKKYINIAPQEICKIAELKSIVFPCLIQINNSPMASLSAGEQLIVFFTKKSTVIPTHRPGKEAEIYHIPMYSTFEFGPISDKGEGANHFNSIADMLSDANKLPKVVKVLKSCIGKTEESSVLGGTLIFPKGVTSITKELECTNSLNDKTLILKLPYVGKFSTHPSDVKMTIVQYISSVNVFPVTVQVFNDNKIQTESHIEMGSQLVLTKPIEVHSYICSKDIFGNNNYPLLEVPVETPVLVKWMKESDIDGINMKTMCDTAGVIYEHFSLSMIENYIPVNEESSFEIQDELNKEIDLNISDAYYELTCPVKDHYYEYVETRAPILQLSIPSPRSSKRNTFPSYPSKDHVTKMTQVQDRSSSMPRQLQATEEKNKAYLRSLSRIDVLLLLDNMNLSHHKESFQREQVDGMILSELDNDDLKDLGVTKGIQQKRLLCLINGSMSAEDLLENNIQHGDSVYY